MPRTQLQLDDVDYEDPDDPFDVEMDDTDLSYQDAAKNLTEILGRSGQPNFEAARLYVRMPYDLCQVTRNFEFLVVPGKSFMLITSTGATPDRVQEHSHIRAPHRAITTSRREE